MNKSSSTSASTASPATRRRYVPAVGPQLKKLLFVVFALFALLATNSAYLVGVTIMEEVSKKTYQNWFYMNMFLVHLVLGLVIVLPVIFFGIGHLRNSYPHMLSGGEKQRTVIARAIVNLPSILVADEPTGNLDPENALGIFELLKQINAQGTTVIMATHNPNLYGNTSFRRITLSQGRLVNKDLI